MDWSGELFMRSEGDDLVFIDLNTKLIIERA